MMETFSKITIMWFEHMALVGGGALIYYWWLRKNTVEEPEIEKAAKPINKRAILSEGKQPQWVGELAGTIGRLWYIKQQKITKEYIYGKKD
jgi:hypothetical protein